MDATDRRKSSSDQHKTKFKSRSAHYPRTLSFFAKHSLLYVCYNKVLNAVCTVLWYCISCIPVIKCECVHIPRITSQAPPLGILAQHLNHHHHYHHCHHDHYHHHYHCGFNHKILFIDVVQETLWLISS